MDTVTTISGFPLTLTACGIWFWGAAAFIRACTERRVSRHLHGFDRK